MQTQKTNLNSAEEKTALDGNRAKEERPAGEERRESPQEGSPSPKPAELSAVGPWSAASRESPDPFDQEQGEKSVAEILDELTRIPLSAVRRTNVASATLVSVGFCYDRLFKEDREHYESAFTSAVFDVSRYDDLYHRAMGYWHLTICLRQAADKRDPLEMLVVEAKPLRAKLLKAALYLWTDDPKLGNIVANIRSGQTYLNQADDMGNLTRLFIENWDDAKGRCDVTKEDVVKAQELGARFLAALAAVKTDEISELKELQLRAGEYLRRGIDDIRAAAAFVFSKDEEKLGRYPVIRRTRRRAGDKTEGEPDTSTEEIVETAEPQSGTPEIPAAPPAQSAAQ